jgi:hypothetical protein
MVIKEKMTLKPPNNKTHFSRILEKFLDKRKVGKLAIKSVISRADKEAHRWPRLDIVRVKTENSQRLSNVD